MDDKAREAWFAARKAWYSKPYTVHNNRSFSLGNNIAAIDAIQTALDEARAEERRKVVEWLRTASKTSGQDYDISGRHLLWVADAIERGEHHG